MRREKKLDLPVKRDISKLAVYLDSKREALFTQLTQAFTQKTWLELCRYTLMSILVLNRKRVGDAQNRLVGDFNRREIITEECAGVTQKF